VASSPNPNIEIRNKSEIRNSSVSNGFCRLMPHGFVKLWAFEWGEGFDIGMVDV